MNDPDHEGADNALVRAARFLFSPRGRLSKRPYAVAALSIVCVSYVVWLEFLIRDVVRIEVTSVPLVLLMTTVLRFWVVVALTVRRAADAGYSGWIALLAAMPAADLIVAIVLSAAPTRHETDLLGETPDRPLQPEACERQRALLSIGIGVVLVIASVIIGALMVGRYGAGLFVYAPFMIGVTTAYFANLSGDIGPWRTAQIQLIMSGISGLALIAVALEGIVCILMAAPLAVPLVLLGGALGRAMAVRLERSVMNTVTGPALLVAMLVLQQLSPTGGTFQSTQSIDIDAPPAEVWNAITDMQPIEETPALPYLLGVAYPVGGDMLGQHEGAIRHGYFSTGTAVEKVTVWRPGVEFAFEVLSEPPSMVEMSFYDTVHAPHVHGYFVTKGGTFRLTELAGGRTRLWERTDHALELEPLAYWLPLARALVRQNNDRVLRHIKRQAEGAR